MLYCGGDDELNLKVTFLGPRSKKESPFGKNMIMLWLFRCAFLAFKGVAVEK